ncbi:hypothetical protein M316_0013 [Nitrincola phage 1M3-16]|uniref:hypothetical protein n=1 Tax=Nitrincola phage 1M3-16 TaxID=1472912 RepID=UPI000444AE84|nr:hypothetical protein GJ22_gp139 [Nitrincola phage 1M3-16]AHX01078.1 hypothetical protein M316_0013 [Nitrincola phage 1M3-16]
MENAFKPDWENMPEGAEVWIEDLKEKSMSGWYWYDSHEGCYRHVDFNQSINYEYTTKYPEEFIITLPPNHPSKGFALNDRVATSVGEGFIKTFVVNTSSESEAIVQLADGWLAVPISELKRPVEVGKVFGSFIRESMCNVMTDSAVNNWFIENLTEQQKKDFIEVFWEEYGDE